MCISVSFDPLSSLRRFCDEAEKFLCDVLLPNLVWRAGRTAGAIRTSALSCLLALLHGGAITPDLVTESHHYTLSHDSQDLGHGPDPEYGLVAAMNGLKTNKEQRKITITFMMSENKFGQVYTFTISSLL